jgi:hypothetical protein
MSDAKVATVTQQLRALTEESATQFQSARARVERIARSVEIAAEQRRSAAPPARDSGARPAVVPPLTPAGRSG